MPNENLTEILKNEARLDLTYLETPRYYSLLENVQYRWNSETSMNTTNFRFDAKDRLELEAEREILGACEM